MEVDNNGEVVSNLADDDPNNDNSNNDNPNNDDPNNAMNEFDLSDPNPSDPNHPNYIMTERGTDQSLVMTK